MNETIDRDDAWRVAQACAWYVANRNTLQFLLWFFDGKEQPFIADRPPNDPYVTEWAERWNRHNFGEIFCAMDYTNQRRFVDEILRLYEADSARTLALCEAHSGLRTPERTLQDVFDDRAAGRWERRRDERSDK